MASNSFGNLFRITTWGESHGKAIGVVVDGCPAGLLLSETDINQALSLRAPGNNAYTSPRKEPDHADILSGVFDGKTTGSPISILIKNHDANSQSYEPIKDLLRPGHANFTYLTKYGIYDYRGGGRASARETACRVAAGAIAKKLLLQFNIEICAYLSGVSDITLPNILNHDLKQLQLSTKNSPLFCPDETTTELIIEKLNNIKLAGDSLGGIVSFIATGLPAGLGDPIYEKIEANLAKAMLSLPASKGFEIGDGFSSVMLNGSTHNDLFIQSALDTVTATNHAGGTLGGITTGMPLLGRVAFKPTSSIQKSQTTVDLQGNTCTLTLPEGSRHDPCVAIRAVPVVEAMCALVLADAFLMNRLAKLSL